jgi:hypothetical protein
MTKILQMTRSLGRAVSETVHEASDPLEPTPHPLPFPMVRPWYPAALVLGARSHDFPHAA